VKKENLMRVGSIYRYVFFPTIFFGAFHAILPFSQKCREQKKLHKQFSFFISFLFFVLFFKNFIFIFFTFTWYKSHASMGKLQKAWDEG